MTKRNRKRNKYDEATIISVANYYVDADSTMVVTAEIKKVPVGSVRYVLEKTKKYSNELYHEVRDQAEKNKIYRKKRK